MWFLLLVSTLHTLVVATSNKPRTSFAVIKKQPFVNRVCMKFEYITKVPYWNKMWLVFQRCLPCGPHISSMLLVLQWSDFLSSWSSKKSSTADVTSLSVRYCFPAKCCCVSCWGTENSQMACQIRRKWRQPVQSHSHAQQPLQRQTHVQKHCPAWNRTPFVSLPGRLRNVSIVLLLKVLNDLSSVRLSGRKQCS